MDWIISFGIGAFLFIITLIGIMLFSWFGIVLREFLEKIDLPIWFYHLLGTLIVIILFAVVIHYGIYGGIK